jgi:L-amino acid N-acyltransferase YncA
VDIRPADREDAAAIAAIHNEGIEERQATFETEPRTAADVEPAIAGELPFLVAVDGDRVVAWAKLSEYSDRCCYDGVAEISVYVGRDARGRGAGRALVDAIGELAAERGLWKVIGLLFPENAGSLALFAAAGYREVGVFRRHGLLDGEWRDVSIVERSLGESLRGHR